MAKTAYVYAALGRCRYAERQNYVKRQDEASGLKSKVCTEVNLVDLAEKPVYIKNNSVRPC